MLAIAGIMVSCGGKKKEGDKPADGKDTTTTTTTTPPTTTTPTSSDKPTFADADVQKYVDDYTAFVNSYLDAVKGKDMGKIQELATKATEWSSKSMEMTKKLAANPDDAKKFGEYMTAMGQKWADAAKELMPKM